MVSHYTAFAQLVNLATLGPAQSTASTWRVPLSASPDPLDQKYLLALLGSHNTDRSVPCQPRCGSACASLQRGAITPYLNGYKQYPAKH